MFKELIDVCLDEDENDTSGHCNGQRWPDDDVHFILRECGNIKAMKKSREVLRY